MLNKINVRFLFLVLVFLCGTKPHSSTSSPQAEIKWQDMAQELDSLKFREHFIDSIKQMCSITTSQYSLDTIHKFAPCVQETLVYTINWGPIEAGYVILTVNPDSQSKVIYLGGKAVSNNIVSAFYKMRDYVISTVDQNGLYPLFFEQHIREGKKFRSDRWVLYDPQNSKAHIKEKSFKTVESPPFTQDYLSVIYRIRSLNITPGDTFSFQTYLSKGIHQVHFRCKQKKKIETEAGKFNCIMIEPKFEGDRRAFNKNDKLEAWLSDDIYRVPVLIKSKIKFGTITARLIYQTHH